MGNWNSNTVSYPLSSQNLQTALQQANQYQQYLQGLPYNASARYEDYVKRLNNSVAGNISNADTNLTALFDGIDSMMLQVKKIYKCISHEYFVGYPDEESMVKRAINTSQFPVIASRFLIMSESYP